MRYIIGTGNYLMHDDSIGLRIVEHISEKRLDQGFKVVDLSSSNIDFLSYLEEQTEKILIIDCAKMGKSPGECVFFSPDKVNDLKQGNTFSTHGNNIIEIISMANKLHNNLPDITIMGIEPSLICERIGLSSELKNNFNDYVNMALMEIRL